MDFILVWNIDYTKFNKKLTVVVLWTLVFTNCIFQSKTYANNSSSFDQFIAKKQINNNFYIL